MPFRPSATGVTLTGCANHEATAARRLSKPQTSAMIRHLIAKATGGSGVDNTPKGPSLGDMLFERGTVTDSTGERAGTYKLDTQLVAGTPQRGDEHESLTLPLRRRRCPRP